MQHPPGTIVVISGDLSRYSSFAMSFCAVEKPMGSSSSWITSADIVDNLNTSVQHMTGEWIWILGDDHVFAPETLMRLLAHNLPAVFPVCCHRKPPFAPIIFREQTADGQYQYWPPAELPETGLLQVAGGSGAGFLVRKYVLDAIGDPWFQAGGITGRRLEEDTYFQQRIRQTGFPIHCDLDTWIGHIGPGAIWPRQTSDEGWSAWVDMSCSVPGLSREEHM